MDVFRSSVGQSMTQTHAAQRGIERIWSHFIGGNSEYHGEETLGPWRKTIELPENWQIIERMDFIPITELLPPEISQEIASLLFRPLIGKWIQSEHIEPIKCTHHQAHQARISENDSKEGWHTLGQSTDGSKILVVKESYWGRGALLSMEAAAVKGISQTQHLTHNDAFYDLRAPSVEYASLGSFFSILPRGSKEVVQGPKEHNRFCFVQRKLLSQAKYSDTPVWEEKSLVKQTKRKVSAWRINPLVVKGVPTTFNLNMCRMALGSNKPNDSAWGLKVDCVDIVDE
ncbi:hypothetical protein CPB86DRAFT_388681 [Serendipita vermifera]|nr:hypothetical protein CPB86DRAFT_388681 [Serendipita vermifera]